MTLLHTLLTTSRLARTGCTVVALAAAVLSFRATADVALTHGAVPPGLEALVPICVEFAYLTAAMLAWARSVDGERAHLEWWVMTSLLLLSVLVNVAHAAEGTWLGRVLAGVPPVTLWLAMEALLREQRRQARKAEAQRERLVRAEERAKVRFEVREQARPALVEVRPAAPAEAHDVGESGASRAEQVRALVQEFHARGESLTGAQVARRLGVSPGYARRLVQQARAA